VNGEDDTGVAVFLGLLLQVCTFFTRRELGFSDELGRDRILMPVIYCLQNSYRL
jgi:hypothetical protein